MNAYPLYPKRISKTLDGVWDFKFIEGDALLEETDFRSIAYDEQMSVPGVFDGGPRHAGRRGIGVYRCFVELGAEGGNCRLKINGLGLKARVFWDGTDLAYTRLAYSPLTVDFEMSAGKRHELVIATDNRFGKSEDELLKPNYDFYCYGGVYRSVSIERLPAVRVERAAVRVCELEKGEVSIRLSLGGNAEKAKVCMVSFDEGEPFKVALKPQAGIAEFKARVPNARLWSPENPALHTVRIVIDGDEIVERFGLRTIKAEKGLLLLNGKSVRLRGVCRHEAHPQFGPALPDSLQVEDIQFLKDLNCNFVRCVHYPQSQEFLDLCDSNGLLVWVESLGWGDGVTRLVNPSFGDLQEQQTRQMARDGINHPSVIIWAFLNEGASDVKDSRGIYERLVKALREEDPSRLVSYASMMEDRDLNYDLADVISMNTYPGWIGDVSWEDIRPLGTIGKKLEGLARFCEKNELKDKALILSEIGTCGLPGWRDRLKAAWSEEFQADYFEEAIRNVFGNPRFSGVSLWQMYDTRTFANGHVRSKARAFNNAGVLDEYRRPKLAYDRVKDVFGKIKDGELDC